MSKQNDVSLRCFLAASEIGIDIAADELDTTAFMIINWVVSPNDIITDLRLNRLSKITGIRYKWLRTGQGRKYKRSKVKDNA